MMPAPLFSARAIASAGDYGRISWHCRSNVTDGDDVRRSVCMHSRGRVPARDVSKQSYCSTHNGVVRCEERMFSRSINDMVRPLFWPMKFFSGNVPVVVLNVSPVSGGRSCLCFLLL